MPNKAFLEITNVCNLSCSFCHGTKRAPRFMTAEEFTRAASELRPFAEYLYFHLMGEPLLHPLLGDFLKIAGDLGFKVILTTNGTLLSGCADTLLGASSLFKVSVSLHSYEANRSVLSLEEYLENACDFCEKLAKEGKIAVFRLWNLEGGEGSLNGRILDFLHRRFPGEWKEMYSGYRLCEKEKVFLEWGNRFDWPDTEAPLAGEAHSCYGLRDQVGVLCDGTVVPCCLDAEGAISLGNIFDVSLSEILKSERAVSLVRSFEEKKVTEELCRRCGYAMRYR